MVNKKQIRTRGKIQFSRYFQELKEGEKVAIILEKAVASSFPKRMQGRTGVIIGKRGNSYIVEIKDTARKKQYIIEPVHLKKIKQ